MSTRPALGALGIALILTAVPAGPAFGAILAGGLRPAAGSWQVSPNGIVTADNVNDSTNLVNQFAYRPNPYPNASLITAMVRPIRLPRKGPYTIGLVDHSAADGNGDYKWSLDLTRRGLELINDGFRVVTRVPFRTQPGRWLHMELLVVDNVVDGRVWYGSAIPKAWQISGTFFRGLARTQPDFGIYAAHADASFRDLRVNLPPGTVTPTPAQPAGIFLPGQKPGYHLALRRGAPGSVHAILRAVITNAADGRWVLTRPVTLTRGRPSAITLPLPVKTIGWYQVQYQLVAQAGGAVLESVPPVGFALVPQPIRPYSQRIGMNISVVSWYLPPAVRRQDIALEFDTLADQGIGFVRLEIDTNLLPDWSIYDPMIGAAHYHRMRILGILDSWPTGKNPFVVKNHITFQAAVQAYEAKVVQIVKRYEPGGTLARAKGWGNWGITDWEIWNEPSIPSRWGGTMRQYGMLVKATAKAVRSVEPDAFLLEYAHHDHHTYEASGDVFNGLAIHYYPGVIPPENAHFPVSDAVSHNLDFLRAEGLPPILWMTELGWNTNLVSPLTQADYLVRGTLETIQGGSQPVFLFIQNFLNSGMGDQHLNFTPKPAYSAVLTLVRMIRGYHPVARLQNGDLWGQIWSNGKAFRMMVWSIGAPVSAKTPPIPGTTVANLMGDAAARSAWTVGGSPWYLTVSGGSSNEALLKAWFAHL